MGMSVEFVNGKLKRKTSHERYQQVEEKLSSKKVIQYHFISPEELFENLPQKSIVFYTNKAMSKDSAYGNVEFQYSTETEQGNIIIYSTTFKKREETKNYDLEDVLVEYMEKFPGLSFIQGNIQVK
jgi:hypothetical protein